MNHGGSRQGSGRKPIQYSEAFRLKLWKALEKEARIKGKTIFEVFATTIMAHDTEPRVFARLWKVLSEIMASKDMHQTTETRDPQPRIFLPPIRKREPTEGIIPVINLPPKKDGYKI